MKFILRSLLLGATPFLLGALVPCGEVRAAPLNATRVQAIALVKRAEAAFSVDLERASALCEEAARLDPTYARAYTWLGAIREKQARLPEARAAYARVLKLSPQSADAERARARLQALAGSVVRVLPSATTVAPRAVAVRVQLDGQELASGERSESGRVLVPLRALFSGLGATVRFQKSGLITASRDATKVSLRMGQREAFINERRVVLDEAPTTRNGRVLVPLRFVAEAFGARVNFDASRALAEVEAPTPRLAQAPLPAPALSNDVIVSPAEPSSDSQPATITPDQLPEQPPVTATLPDEPAPVEAAPTTPDAQPDTLPAPAAQDDAPTLVGKPIRMLTRTRVAGVNYYGGWSVSENDPDITFDLQRRWNVFVAQVAMPDDAKGEYSELRGWFDGQPAQRAFPPLKVYRGRKPVTLRIRLDNATRFTLAPGFPGRSLVLLSARFERN